MGISTGANIPVVTIDQLETAVAQRRAKTGRPSSYSEEVAAEIVERLSNGETMTNITKAKRMPAHGTVCDWQRKLPAFAQAIAQARLDYTDATVDKAEAGLQAVDGKAKDNQVRKAEAIARFALDIAARRNFQVYGEKKQNLNINLNAEVAPVDLAGYLNR